MLQLPKANKGRKGTVQKVCRQKDRVKEHGRHVNHLQQDLIEKIDHAQKQEAKWYEEGNRLKTEYTKIYGDS